MSLNMDLLGKTTAPIKYKYSWKDCVLYALGVGAKSPDELNVLWEGNGPKVLPTFAVVPSFVTLMDIVGKLKADYTKILHGEQTIILHRPIPSSGELSTIATVTGIYDKGKGALVTVEAKTNDAKGEPVFDNVFSIFVRGAGGFGRDRGPQAVQADPPEGKDPDFSFTETTTTEQAALYRLSGDLNPLHINPQLAKMARFDAPILHGLCTYGFAGRAVVNAACGGDVAKLKRFAARFSGIVYPGDELTTSGWQVEPGKYVVRVTKQDGSLVLSNSLAEVAI